MSENKDQNRDKSKAEDAEAVASSTEELSEQLEANPEQDLADIDNILGEEDPQFLKQLSDIKIPPGVSLSVLDGELAEKPYKASVFQQIKKIFNIKKNPKVVISFWLVVVVITGAVLFVWNANKNLFEENLFLNSYATWNHSVQDYNPLSETEAFYDNPRFSKNLMTLSKMFINVKSSENSGTTPMLALEVNVEGISADAIIEIKDREAEFKDLLLRFVEDQTYDELTTTEGKKNLCDQFRIIINSHLTQGQVRRVLLKSFIIKP
ncbi:MAG: flagellar basal body-associated FliL family protein [Bdellovibrio sp.]|nr:flagellar basal body-associated FliL family protein [Bdellovibrio sp.]